jgi:hypothetical protein
MGTWEQQGNDIGNKETTQEHYGNITGMPCESMKGR